MNPAHRHGFTVVEVFLVITLLAIVAALMVVPVQRLADSLKVRPLSNTVLAAVRQAHIEARQRNASVRMFYSGESNVLELCTIDGIRIDTVPLVPAGNEDPDASLLALYRLVPDDPEGDAIAYENEEEEVEYVTFHPAGVSTPFAIDFVERSTPLRLVMDPFSSEPVLIEAEGDES